MMRKRNWPTKSAVIALCGIVSLLGACHTMNGAGQDISGTGHALSDSAQKNTP